MKLFVAPQTFPTLDASADGNAHPTGSALPDFGRIGYHNWKATFVRSTPEPLQSSRWNDTFVIWCLRPVLLWSASTACLPHQSRAHLKKSFVQVFAVARGNAVWCRNSQDPGHGSLLVFTDVVGAYGLSRTPKSPANDKTNRMY